MRFPSDFARINAKGLEATAKFKEANEKKQREENEKKKKALEESAGQHELTDHAAAVATAAQDISRLSTEIDVLRTKMNTLQMQQQVERTTLQVAEAP